MWPAITRLYKQGPEQRERAHLELGRCLPGGLRYSDSVTPVVPGFLKCRMGIRIISTSYHWDDERGLSTQQKARHVAESWSLLMWPPLAGRPTTSTQPFHCLRDQWLPRTAIHQASLQGRSWDKYVGEVAYLGVDPRGGMREQREGNGEEGWVVKAWLCQTLGEECLLEPELWRTEGQELYPKSHFLIQACS